MGKSIMWQYIAEEPKVLGELLQSDQTDAYAKKHGSDIRAIYFVAHGSSFNAATCVLGYYSKYAGVRAYSCTPGNFCSGSLPICHESRDDTLVVVISQTGTSSGTLTALENAKAQGFKTLAITGVPRSPLDKSADACLLLHCGEEDSNAKTKGYSATLTVLLQLAISIGTAAETLSAEKASRANAELAQMVALIPEVTYDTIRLCEEMDIGRGIENLYFLGSGMNYGTALEGQLKLMETMCMPTMFNDIGEFSHGMHRAIDKQSALILIKSSDEMQTSVEQAYQYLKGITSKVFLIDATGSGNKGTRFCVPVFELSESILLTTLIVQIISVFAPELNGCDPNRNSHNEFTLVAGTRV